MADTMQTLKEIAVLHAKKQAGMVDSITEEAPILATVRWMPASHNLWNVAEEVSDVTGPGFVDMNAPLPNVGVSSNLRKIDLSIMGGEMEVAEDKADQFKGAPAYFAKRQPRILRKAGMDTEVTLYYENWLRYAIDNKQIVNAGASSGATNSILVVRFDEDGCTGLYDPSMFNEGTLLRVDLINNGSCYHLRSMPGVLGYGVRLRGRFGFQLMMPQCVAAIVNIQKGKEPTAMMIDDAVAMARGTSANTYIFCHSRVKGQYINPHKNSVAHNSEDKRINRTVETWNDIGIVTSYNLKYDGETVVTMP